MHTRVVERTREDDAERINVKEKAITYFACLSRL